jgi:hypothetical protein
VHLTLPIQLDRAWEDLRWRMGETPQIQLCRVCSITPKKTQCCNCCQRCFNKVLSKESDVNVIFQICINLPKPCYVIQGYCV